LKIDASLLIKINTVNSLIVLALSFLQFKNTILPGAEIYFSMFLAVISLTFNNQINFGSRKLTWAAMICLFLIVVIQLYYLEKKMDSLFTQQLLNLLIIISSSISAFIFLYYLASKRVGY